MSKLDKLLEKVGTIGAILTSIDGVLNVISRRTFILLLVVLASFAVLIGINRAAKGAEKVTAVGFTHDGGQTQFSGAYVKATTGDKVGEVKVGLRTGQKLFVNDKEVTPAEFEAWASTTVEIELTETPKGLYFHGGKPAYAVHGPTTTPTPRTVYPTIVQPSCPNGRCQVQPR